MAEIAQITLDGPAASGKSSAAKGLAKELNAYFVNTGDMYRALTSVVIAKGIDPETQADAVEAILPEQDIRYVSGEGLDLLLHINGELAEASQVRSPEVAAKVSLVAKIPAVRKWLVKRQREAAELGLIVMEGRDIGTVVFPEAKFKFYVSASPMVRAQRRLAQEGEVSEGATVEKVAAEIAKRDEMDMNRAVSPLKPAEDAVMVDTSDLSLEAVIAMMAERVKKGLAEG
ncbi:cytidylate kinase [Lentisphaera araneosa HTCC2155]|uniref:Cytidylate kinase n=1 Tax=Lentisphaera araneosa HTCC2155 TaxID=313628 RepID=A6DJZ0_9BACT|nr:(d)CMP kinase [Lentisphaera araneosa]EDM28214.1 cytidylate kinase [Lentisphaera araneosa HTCC2155]